MLPARHNRNTNGHILPVQKHNTWQQVNTGRYDSESGLGGVNRFEPCSGMRVFCFSMEFRFFSSKFVVNEINEGKLG